MQLFCQTCQRRFDVSDDDVALLQHAHNERFTCNAILTYREGCFFRDVAALKRAMKGKAPQRDQCASDFEQPQPPSMPIT